MRSTEKSFGAKRGSSCNKLGTDLRLDLAKWTAPLYDRAMGIQEIA